MHALLPHECLALMCQLTCTGTFDLHLMNNTIFLEWGGTSKGEGILH